MRTITSAYVDAEKIITFLNSDSILELVIEEMKEELNNGNLEEVHSIANDIDENEKKIMQDQLKDYATRKNMPLEEAERWLRPVLE